MKAKDLDKNLFPRSEVVQAYKEVGQEYERTIQDRVYEIWYALVTADPVKNQEIEQRIHQMYRIKDAKGKEWLVYDSTLYGNTWEGNQKDFYYREGIIEGMPRFEKRIDPSTNAVIAGTTQIQEILKPGYTILFTKDKVNELQKCFVHPLTLNVVDGVSGLGGGGSRMYSCSSLEEFRDIPYEELINLKTGMADYWKNKNKVVSGIGGVGGVK
jgi:hypothetical protein